MWALLWLLAVHWVADFVCQTHWQASNKSKRFDALARHVASYTLVLAAGVVAGVVVGIIRFNVDAFAAFVAINCVLHLGTDALTSRWTASLYAKGDWHNFFVVIGLDQLIHQATLALLLAAYWRE